MILEETGEGGPVGALALTEETGEGDRELAGPGAPPAALPPPPPWGVWLLRQRKQEAG